MDVEEETPDCTSLNRRTVFSGMRRCQPIVLKIHGHDVTSKNHVKYLGVTLDKSLPFSKHVNVTPEKARTTAASSTLMPNVGGYVPTGARREKRLSTAFAAAQGGPERRCKRSIVLDIVLW